MPWKRKKCWTADTFVPLGRKFLSSVRQRTGSWISRGTRPPRRGIHRGKQTVPAAIPVTGDYFRAQPVRGGLSQPAKLTREFPVLVRLASLARNCGDRLHDPPGSRARCLSSVQCVRTAQCRRALLGAIVPVGPSASRRIPLAVRFSALVWELEHSRQPLLRAHRQYLRLGFGSLEIASGSGRRQVQPLTSEQPANDFLCDRQDARGQNINLTLSLVCTLSPRVHVSVFLGPKQLFPSKQQIAHISGSTCGLNGGKEEEESSGRTSTLRVSRHSLRLGAVAWGARPHHCESIVSLDDTCDARWISLISDTMRHVLIRRIKETRSNKERSRALNRVR